MEQKPEGRGGNRRNLRGRRGGVDCADGLHLPGRQAGEQEAKAKKRIRVCGLFRKSIIPILWEGLTVYSAVNMTLRDGFPV